LSEAAHKPRRRRRTAEEARHAILEAAQKRLAERGPEEIRLQDIASDLGISHPAILHHFGSREALMTALSRHAFECLNADMVAALSDRDGDATAWLDRVFETLRDRGHARLLAWGTLTGRLGGTRGRGGEPQLIRDLASAVQARREVHAEREGEAPPPFEDTVFVVQLISAALLGDALMGDVLRQSAGISADEVATERYRRWLAEKVRSLLLPDRRRSSSD
jgi:AcrR family transcriptional regulator